jgi:hypothetical protein
MDVKGIEFAYPSKYWWSTIPLISGEQYNASIIQKKKQYEQKSKAKKKTNNK